MEKYKCNECGHNFNGDEYTLNCPVCDSSEIISVSHSSGSTIKDKIIQNKRILIIIGIIIVIASIIIYQNSSEDADNKDNTSLNLKINTKTYDDYILIKIIDKDADIDKKVLTYENNQTLFNSANFEAYQNNNKVAIKKGIIYPCGSGPIKLTWIKGFGNINHISKIIKFKFKNNAIINPNAICKEKLEMTVKLLDSCKIKINSNYDTLYPNEKLLISINGHNGTYKNQKIWTLNKKEKGFEVWGFVEGQNDTIQPIINPKGMAKGCDPFDANSFENAAVLYANNPKSLSALASFRNNLPKNTIIKYEGVIQKGGINDLSNKLSTEFMNNDTTFNVKIDWKTNKKGVKSGVKYIKFTKKK